MARRVRRFSDAVRVRRDQVPSGTLFHWRGDVWRSVMSRFGLTCERVTTHPERFDCPRCRGTDLHSYEHGSVYLVCRDCARVDRGQVFTQPENPWPRSGTRVRIARRQP